MAPEVLSKGTAYDSSADWFSFGCMLYKLLKGHSPFRQHKTKVNKVTTKSGSVLGFGLGSLIKIILLFSHLYLFLNFIFKKN